MNKYVRTFFCFPFGFLKVVWTKFFHFSSFKCSPICLLSPFSEITLDYGAKLYIGKRIKMRDGAKIRVRKDAVLTIGNNCSLNSNNIITCHERIDIGDRVQLSPNVLIYDHDHSFNSINGVEEGKYKTAPIKIGNNVWIGANTVILRGTEIGDNSVIGAGSVIKGKYEPGSVIIQKRLDKIRKL